MPQVALKTLQQTRQGADVGAKVTGAKVPTHRGRTSERAQKRLCPLDATHHESPEIMLLSARPVATHKLETLGFDTGQNRLVFLPKLTHFQYKQSDLTFLTKTVSLCHMLKPNRVKPWA